MSILGNSNVSSHPQLIKSFTVAQEAPCDLSWPYFLPYIIYSLLLSPIPFYTCSIALLAVPPIGWVLGCLHWLGPGLGMLLPQVVTLFPLDEASPKHHLYNCSILPTPYSGVSPRHLLVSNIVYNLLFMLIVYLPPLRSVREGGFVFSSSMYRIG